MKKIKNYSLGLYAALIVIVFLFSCENAASQSIENKLGEKGVLIRGSNMPYITAKVGAAEGLFLIDFGTTFSTIDPKGFANDLTPKPISGASNKFNDFDFFGSQGQVTLEIQDHSNIKLQPPLKQAGIIGTDFLSEKVFTLDYVKGFIYASIKETFPSDDVLLNQGFKPVSTAGYYSNDLRKLNDKCVANVPTIPIKIGSATAVAQIDPGYDDILYNHSVNINRAFFNSLKAAGITLELVPNGTIEISTCVPGVKEKITRYNLGKNNSLEIIGTDGKAVFITTDATLFLKESPLEAKNCGGIGAWQIPAAQLGASFLIDAKQLVFDPFTSLVWFEVGQNNKVQSQVGPNGEIINGMRKGQEVQMPTKNRKKKSSLKNKH